MKQLQPFERDNVIFIDTEFSDLDPMSGELLSIGIVKQDGSELYIELATEAKPSDWVAVNILPMLDGPKLSQQQARDEIESFLGGKLPFAVAFVDNYDVIYLTKLFGAGKLPFRWMTIDFASVLFALGINPVRFLADQSDAKSFYRDIGIDLKKYRQHHALDDARLLRDVWQKLCD